jgi:head-tail adaptor
MARGDYRHLVTFQNPAPAVPDGDGAYTETWTDCSPATWFVSLTPATAANLERAAVGTVTSMATHLVRGDVHPDVTTQTRMLFDGRTFSITGKAHSVDRAGEMELGAVEVVP